MSIKQISQLETLNLSSVIESAEDEEHPNGHKLKDNGNVLSNYLFEVSEFTEEKNEAVSYYQSRKLDGLQLSSMLLTDVWNKMKYIDGKAKEIWGNSYSSPL